MATLTKSRADKVRKDAKVAAHNRHREKILTIARLVYSASVDVMQFQGGLRTLYIAWGYESVEEWAFKELCLEAHEVTSCIVLWEKFGLKLKCARNKSLMNLIARVSFERLVLIQPVINSLKDARKWLKLAAILPLMELKEKVKRAQGREGSKGSGTAGIVFRDTIPRVDVWKRHLSVIKQRLGVKTHAEAADYIFKHCASCPNFP